MRITKVINGLLACTALGLGLHLMIAPRPSFDASRDYGPNPVQQEFLKLLARQHDYVGLGDTNHQRVELKLFAHNPRTLAALAQGGVKNYFLELATQHQPEIDRVRNSSLSYKRNSAWLCLPSQRDKITMTFNDNVISNGSVNFIAADKRDILVDPHKNLNGYQSFIYAHVPRLYYKAYGCVTDRTYALASWLTFGTADGKFIQGVIDDTKTTVYMKSFPGKGVSLYGALHFEDAADNGTSMRSLLTRDGKSLVIVNLFMNAATKSQYDDLSAQAALAQGRSYQKADIAFYLNPSREHPYGIEVINPRYAQAYAQAKRNAEQARIVMK